jgi:hypothetical protein
MPDNAPSSVPRSARCVSVFLRMGCADEEAEDVIDKARGLVAAAVDQFVLGRLAGELLLDLAHFGKAEHVAHPGRVGSVFRRQIGAADQAALACP